MMLEKVVFFMPQGQYGTTCHFTRQLSAALERKGVATETFDFDEDDVLTVMEVVQKEQPDCTFTFNPILPLSDGRLFCDYVKIPHFNALVDISLDALFLLKSPYSMISCVDQSFCDYLKASAFQNGLWWPHGVEEELVLAEDLEKSYEVVLLGTCIDFEGVYETMQRDFAPEVMKIVDRVTEQVFADAETSYFSALLHELGEAGMAPQDLPLSKLFRGVERYIKGKGRVEMIRALPDVDVHVFGKSLGVKGWDKYLQDKPRVTVCDALPFHEAVEVMKRSKVILSSVPFFKKGSHERLLYGLAAGAAVVTDDTQFNGQEFQEEDGVLLQQAWNPQAIHEKLRALLDDEGTRRKWVKQGQAKVLQKHTWDARAQEWLDKIPAMLQRIRGD